mgnify:CR=1 FL=1
MSWKFESEAEIREDMETEEEREIGEAHFERYANSGDDPDDDLDDEDMEDNDDDLDDEETE